MIDFSFFFVLLHSNRQTFKKRKYFSGEMIFMEMTLFIIYYTFIELFFGFCHIFINFASKISLRVTL